MSTESDRIPLEPQRGRYFARHRGINAAFRLIDATLAVTTRVARALRPTLAPRPIRRVLVCNGAHLGDVVLATAVLPVLKAALPGVRIGMLVGSWGQPVVRDHPMLDWVHRVDHFRANRSDKPLREKLGQWWRTRRQALQEIRAVNYDVAIDLYFYFPNSVALLWQASIPERIGYTSAGLGPLLTRSLDVRMQGNQQSMAEFHLALLRLIPGIGPLDVGLARPPISRTQVDIEALAGDGPYVVMHIGSGSALKDWPEEAWLRVGARLNARGHRLVLTGAGARERAKIDRFRANMPGAMDLCDKLSWSQFIEVLAHAEVIVSSDTGAAHLAAALDQPVIITGHGMANVELWQPPGPRAHVLMKPVPCAPCYRNGGCTSMECLRGLPADAVADAALLELAEKDALPAFSPT